MLVYKMDDKWMISGYHPVFMTVSTHVVDGIWTDAVTTVSFASSDLIGFAVTYLAIGWLCLIGNNTN
jgi:hypothetical protein